MSPLQPNIKADGVLTNEEALPLFVNTLHQVQQGPVGIYSDKISFLGKLRTKLLSIGKGSTNNFERMIEETEGIEIFNDGQTRIPVLSDSKSGATV